MSTEDRHEPDAATTEARAALAVDLPGRAGDPAYSGRHPGDADPRDPGFCRCGLGLDAWVHTDTTHYREVPLSEWGRRG